jgi:hypothetical protein
LVKTLPKNNCENYGPELPRATAMPKALCFPPLLRYLPN